MNPATKISLSTVRLECYGPGVGSVGTGYLYFYQFSKDEIYPVIVTNKHVVEGADQLNAVFTIIKQGVAVGGDGVADGEERFPVKLTDFLDNTFLHPDPDVDLCVILLGTTLNSIRAGWGVKNVFLNNSWHVEPELASIIRPIETVIMVGYPNGIWDQVNNRPLTRRGLTASHPLKSWNGQRQFVVDAACFPGSSGSPVFLYEDGIYRSPGDVFTPGTRVKLLGTLWGGPTVDAQGVLVDKEIPASIALENQKVPVIKTMMNLGYVIHADALNDFAPLIKEFMKRYQ
jgi:hypothetical protein